MQNIKYSGFSLAKGRELRGDDFYDIQTLGNLSVAIVCDGVGSADEGAEAARRVCSYLMKNLKVRPKTWSIEKSLLNFTKSINSILYQESMTQYERCELVTTLSIVVIEGNRLYGANVGDTRVYLLRDGVLNKLSQDHAMEEAGYENVLTQAIGIDKDVSPYYFENIIQKDDKILLCSDGLYTLMSDDRLQSGMKLGASALVKKASKLMDDKLPDDTTAVVLDVLQADEMDVLRKLALPIAEKLTKGEVIDGYTLEKSLIQNNRTWLSSRKGKEYVLKFAPTEAMEDEKILDLFVKEAWNAKRLKNKVFPKAVIPKKRSLRYYVMEYFEGENLHDFLEKKHIGVDDAVALAGTLLNMSQYLLSYDLVHGDIKPHNIMIAHNEDKTTNYKVIDYGSISEIFSTTSRAGTPSFLSPQRFQGEALSESSEIFAIGVTLYFALTNKYPYGEIEPFQNPSFKQAKKPSFYNRNIPAWLDSVILRAIAIESEIRYEHYSEMLFELRNPQKVKPFFAKHTTLMQRSPVLFYRTAFTIMFLLNIAISLWCLSR